MCTTIRILHKCGRIQGEKVVKCQSRKILGRNGGNFKLLPDSVKHLESACKRDSHMSYVQGEDDGPNEECTHCKPSTERVEKWIEDMRITDADDRENSRSLGRIAYEELQERRAGMVDTAKYTEDAKLAGGDDRDNLPILRRKNSYLDGAYRT